MANYEACSRTNYFRVTDEARYAELFANLVSDSGEVYDFSKTENGIIFHGFGSYASIDYVTSSDGDSYVDFDYFLSELQKILPDDEAFIYFECGHEKLRYLTGFTIVATKAEIRSVDICSDAVKLARKMLSDETFYMGF